MKLNSIRQAGVWAAAWGLCCVALASAPAAHAEDKMTAQSLIDRQLILDQITRYYYNFGKAERQAEESFYAEDGELILGTRHYKGREGIKSARMLDRLQRDGADAEIIALPHGIADQIDAAQVRQEPRLRLVIGMADLVADLGAFAR